MFLFKEFVLSKFSCLNKVGWWYFGLKVVNGSKMGDANIESKVM